MRWRWEALPVWLIRLLKFEFWPYIPVYVPAMIYVGYWTLRLGNKFYLFSLNPAIGKDGGFSEPVKSEINALFPEEYLPKEIQYKPGQNIEEIISIVSQKIGFPCFAKPENLVKGIGVLKIETSLELKKYLHAIQTPLIVQEYLSAENEYAVFIAKIPGQPAQIIGLTQKHLLYVTGDGNKTARELLQHSLDYKMASRHLEKFRKHILDSVPSKNEKLLIQPVGNHNKGTRFEDISSKINESMNETINRILPQKGVYYGRFDIKAPDLMALETGNGLKIIEFNGSIAEPVNYLDRSYGFFRAQKVILHHYKHQKNIGRYRIQQNIECPGIIAGIDLALKAKRKYTKASFTLSDEIV